MKVIDTHSHWGTEKGYPLRTAEERAHQVKIWKTEARFWSEDEMADYFREHGALVMLDFAFTRHFGIDELVEHHDYAIEFQRKNSDVVLGNWLQIDPRLGKDGVREARRVLDAKAGKLGIALSGIGNGVPVTDEIYKPFLDFCADASLPVLIFTGYTGVGAGRPGGDGIVLELGHVRHIDAVAAKYPSVQFVAGRNPWPWHEDMIAIMMHKGNVWAEYHGMTPRRLPPSLKQAIAGPLKDRVMFGADFPFLRYELLLKHWQEEDYKPEVLEKILVGNARRLFDLAEG